MCCLSACGIQSDRGGADTGSTKAASAARRRLSPAPQRRACAAQQQQISVQCSLVFYVMHAVGWSLPASGHLSPTLSSLGSRLPTPQRLPRCAPAGRPIAGASGCHCLRQPRRCSEGGLRLSSLRPPNTAGKAKKHSPTPRRQSPAFSSCVCVHRIAKLAPRRPRQLPSCRVCVLCHVGLSSVGDASARFVLCALCCVLTRGHT